MSTEKNQSQEIKVQTNILKFPNCKENQLLSEHKKLNDQLINYFAWSAAHFKKNNYLAETLFKSTILNFKIDLQTYIKCTLSLIG